ncbi:MULTISPECIES: LysR family transcriptional regulator [Paraburkholderia]|uniref:LysR family transcriptional regulator n=1 Tax=Paraburkholderia TaxID=1822464 RepID=UPI00225080B6|nr:MULTISPECIES: LysR family transcriptional regulator [Paraburkholderia]MCX4162742.1 LysR family transcriptional regulator [Paraburkholderia megapolitana]MDN7158237.1 LysR family transcriptional regulator [Paraburkholderia sp. CHISQ3]MDQ6495284.1 LysR family transcriptional regulator [Paraburkholderia megapolitana]
MEIHQLKTFVAVAREGSITRASERLCLSQPAVSAHVKAMEDMLGITLFERTARGMSLTGDGQRILIKAEHTLDTHRDLIDEATRLKGHLAGRLRLGAGGRSSAASIGRLLWELSEHHPEVEVTIQHGTSLDTLNGILHGELDAGFYNEATEPDVDLATIEVSRFGIDLAAPVGLIDPSQPVNWQALGEYPWIFPTTSLCCGQVAENLFRTHGFRPRRIMSIDRESVTRTLLAGGIGVGLLHADTAREAQLCGDVDIVCEAQKTVRVMFAHLASRGQDPLLKAVGSILRSGPVW